MLVNQLRTGALDLMVVYRSNVLSNRENAEKYLEIPEPVPPAIECSIMNSCRPSATRSKCLAGRSSAQTHL